MEMARGAGPADGTDMMPKGDDLTRLGEASPSGDDSGLPDVELGVLSRARALVPRVAARAAAAAKARRLPPETIAEYRAAGILRILQPRRFGGLQGRFSLFSRIVEELTWLRVIGVGLRGAR